MIGTILNKLGRNYTWRRQGIEQTDQWQKIKVNDIVEYASQFSENIRYRVTAIDADSNMATVRRLDDADSEHESYQLALVMLRNVA